MVITTAVLVATVITLISLLIYKLAYRNFEYWKNKQLVYKQPVPFLGTYAKLLRQKQNFGEAAREIYNEFPKEKVVGTYFGNIPSLLIRDPEYAKLIMAKDFYYFNSRGFDFDWKQEPLELNVFSASGDYWRVLRQNMTPLFSSAKMRNMFHLIVQCGSDFEIYMENQYEHSEDQEVRDLAQRFTMDVIGTCAFGLKMNSMSEDENMFREVGTIIFNPTAWTSVKGIIRLLMPSIYYFLRMRVFEPNVENFFIDLVRKVISLREGKPVERHDFIDLLAELKKQKYIKGDSIEGMKGEHREIELELDDNCLGAQSFIFFAAGFETSATTTSYALYELAMNQDIQARLHSEIDELLKKYDNKITYEILSEATYMDMVISETLRKYPVLGVIDRQCTNNYTFPDGKLTVDKGVRIQLPVLALHYDPQYYPDPEKFDPERFTPDAKKGRHQYTYIPFGEGHRICIGMRFGKMQVMVGLITFLKNYSVEPCARTEDKITFNPRSVITTAINGIWLKMKSRKKKC